MNAAKKLIVLMTFICFVASAKTEASEENGNVKNIIDSYQQAITWKEKRDACLVLIDSGLVVRGTLVEKLREIFGSDLFRASGKDAENSVWFVHFEKQPKSQGDSMGAPFVGWYLLMRTDRFGKLEEYSLSNLHK